MTTLANQSVAKATVDAHHVLPEKTHGQLSASLRKPEVAKPVDVKPLIGRAIQRAVTLAGMSNKEAAAHIGVNDSQFGKWLSGNEPPQVHRVFAVVALRQPLVLALAECCEADGITIKTVVTLERRLA